MNLVKATQVLDEVNARIALLRQGLNTEGPVGSGEISLNEDALHGLCLIFDDIEGHINSVRDFVWETARDTET